VHGVWRTATFQHSYGQCWVTLALPLRGHLAYQILDPERTSRDAHRMPQSKRPALRKQDRVTLSRIKSPIPAYAGKPFVGREDVLTVSHITGTGAKRNPWGVVVTDGTHFWHLEPGDVTPAETPISVCTGCRQPAHASETDDAGYHPGCVPTERGGQKHSTKKHLDNWLNSHGYRHAHARKQKTPHPYTVSPRMDHATRKKSKAGAYAASGRQGSASRAHATKNTQRLPFSTRKCYACDSGEAVGVRDRRQEGGMIEAACSRHADPTISAYPACCICGGSIRPTSYDVDGTFVHKACHAEDCK